MKKLPTVEAAKALMNEARDWSVWRWLLEKRRVRAAADEANAALAALDKKVKSGWSEELKQAYRALAAKAGADHPGASEAIRLAVEQVKKADDMAENARLDAEAIFDEAERRLSTTLAREGTQKAIASWELREKAIRQAEALGRKQASAAYSEAITPSRSIPDGSVPNARPLSPSRREAQKASATAGGLKRSRSDA